MAIDLILAAALAGAGALAVNRRAARREAAAEAAFPPTGRIVDADGQAVHVHVEGEGPDLILIHGANGNTRDFTWALMPRLRDRFRVIAMDRPGLGWSQDAGVPGIDPREQARILRAAAAQLGVQRPVVLGQSYGGSVAMAWALAEPDLGALVIVSGATMPWQGGLGPWYTVPASTAGAATLLPLVSAFAPYDRAAGLMTTIFAPDPVPPGYADHIAVPLVLRRRTLRTNARQVNGLKPHLIEMAADYPRLTLPVEIVHGSDDWIVPADIHALPLADRLAAAALDIIPGAGHMPHHTHVDRVIDAIDRARLRAGP